METTIKWDNGKENGNYYIVYWGYIGIMEKTMLSRDMIIVCIGRQLGNEVAIVFFLARRLQVAYAMC